MRIGVDVRCLLDGTKSGVHEYTYSLLRTLFERYPEHEFHLFANAWRFPESALSWTKEYPSVALHAFHVPNKLLNLAFWYKAVQVDRLLGGVDVFFLPNLNFISLSKDVPLVVTAHDLSFELFPETFSWKQRVWHFLVNFRGLVRRAERVIAVSESTKDDISRTYGIQRGKIQVIPSAIREGFGIIDRNDSRFFSVKERYRLPFKFILSLGNFEPRKNLVSLVKAFELLSRSGSEEAKKYHLVLAGHGGWKERNLLRAIWHSPVRGKIHVLRSVTEEEKPFLYGLSSLFVYPSLYEGFGFPPLEAMASGIPVVVAHSSSLPEVVGDAGVLIDPYRPDEIFHAMNEVLTNHELGRALREKSALQSRKFSWESSASLTMETLSSCVDYDRKM